MIVDHFFFSIERVLHFLENANELRSRRRCVVRDNRVGSNIDGYSLACPRQRWQQAHDEPGEELLSAFGDLCQQEAKDEAGNQQGCRHRNMLLHRMQEGCKHEDERLVDKIERKAAASQPSDRRTRLFEQCRSLSKQRCRTDKMQDHGNADEIEVDEVDRFLK